ncbi:unnamed protein product [Echinostoma caproni]|uniref:Uncharacterized protein n=1 Tax=Echinostoma caproni TaxID=27848 RepID=A0A3P8LDY4_9TREM|nr:unnamed protein product [Echinostoma caproni]
MDIGKFLALIKHVFDNCHSQNPFWEVIFHGSKAHLFSLCFLNVSLQGYLVGMILAFVASMLSYSGQPALLYLCPCTLGFTVVTACCCGGREELYKLWNGQFPIALSPPTYTPAPDDEEDPNKTTGVFTLGANHNRDTVVLPSMTAGDRLPDAQNNFSA